MTLKEELAGLRARAETKRPAEVVAAMHRAVDELRTGGALDRVIKAGERAPEFTLPNQSGQPVSSSALLARGPLVVSFYRGAW